MIPEDIRARIAALVDSDRALTLAAVVAPIKTALAQFEAGKIGERELIAVELAVNAILADFPHASLSPFAAQTETALRDRIAELDAGAA